MTGGVLRKSESALSTAYEITPPPALANALPHGLQVVAAYFDPPLSITGAARLRIRIENSDKTASFMCTSIPEAVDESAIITFNQNDVYARLEFFEQKLDTVYVFLPTTRVM